MAEKTSRLRLFSHSKIAVAISLALLTTGCLGAFDKQPPRYNHVSGSKRMPLSNPKGKKPQIIDSIDSARPGGRSPQAQIIQNTPYDDAGSMRSPPSFQQPPSPAIVAPPQSDSSPVPLNQVADEFSETSPHAKAGPSPLYYYEQERASINAQDISDSPETVYETTLGDIAPDLPVESHYSPPLPSEAAPLKAAASPVLPPPTDYPKLSSIQSATPDIQDKFTAVKHNASEFQNDYNPRAVTNTAPLPPQKAGIAEATEPSSTILPWNAAPLPSPTSAPSSQPVKQLDVALTTPLPHTPPKIATKSPALPTIVSKQPTLQAVPQSPPSPQPIAVPAPITQTAPPSYAVRALETPAIPQAPAAVDHTTQPIQVPQTPAPAPYVAPAQPQYVPAPRPVYEAPAPRYSTNTGHQTPIRLKEPSIQLTPPRGMITNGKIEPTRYSTLRRSGSRNTLRH